CIPKFESLVSEWANYARVDGNAAQIDDNANDAGRVYISAQIFQYIRKDSWRRPIWRAMLRKMASYFLNRSSNALRASLGRMEAKPRDGDPGETVTVVGAVSFSIVVRNV